MSTKLISQRAAWLLSGLVAGIGIAFFLAGRPSYAVATDHSDEFAIATGPITTDQEAVYLLDFTSGRLLGTVLNTQTGKFQPFSERNLAEDFALSPRGGKPKFVMVTGLMQVARAQVPTNHVLYVAELRAGRMGAYYMPITGTTTRGTLAQPIQPIDMTAFRQTAGVRQQ